MSKQKLCAADLGGKSCPEQRADGSIFCPRHKRADSRTYFANQPITNEKLAYMMQRDGEQQ